MKILVTGATGFIGKNVVERLLKEGHDLVLTSSGGENPLPNEVKNSKKHKVINYGLEGIDWRYVSSVDSVIHLAANNDTRCQDENEMFRANVFGPIKLFTTAASGRCKNFVYASSTAVYGNEDVPYVENETPEIPLNIYGESKRKFDEFAMDFAEKKDIKVIGLRYCNVYGPGEDHKGKRMSMIGQLLRSMHKGKSTKLFKSGEQRRDWVYIDDVTNANMLALSSEKSGIYNIGSGFSTSFNEIVFEIKDLLKEMDYGYAASIPMPEYIDCPFGSEYQSHTLCNIEKARSNLGFEPKFDLATGLRAYLDYLKNQ